eukprot:CAMPEP_0185469632 /NCGR_PEP_ID=MMETSP1365-20130426/98328_1 /TAXON_ID=38817 /ORGANISM="Gephyrocapsa oceanica, Strain RCC1303" /LENGTH=342 /DNA_ID=CAMNT_0028076373 /DNA_START=28 /DNA_END=1057 /DNA_ORIENTATION=+
MSPPPKPPALLAAFIVLVSAFALQQLRSGVSSERYAKADVCASDHLPTAALGAVRLVFAALILATIAYANVCAETINVTLMYLPESAMKTRHGGPDSFEIFGLRRNTTFTMLSFLLLGIYFAAAGAWPGGGGREEPLIEAVEEGGEAAAGVASLAGACDGASVGVLSIVLTSLLNALYPAHLLLSFATTWVLIPAALRKTEDAARVFGLHTPLLAHNANIAMVSAEVLLSKQRLLPELWPLSALYGVFYVGFAWWWASKHRLFYYFFIDVTLPLPKAVGFHLALFAVLAVASQLGALLSDTVRSGGPAAEAAAALAVTWCGTRIRFVGSKWWAAVGGPARRP